MKLDRFNEAISQYRIAIDLGEKCLKTRMESRISRRMNLTMALRNKFYGQFARAQINENFNVKNRSERA